MNRIDVAIIKNDITGFYHLVTTVNWFYYHWHIYFGVAYTIDVYIIYIRIYVYTVCIYAAGCVSVLDLVAVYKSQSFSIMSTSRNFLGFNDFAWG